MREQPIVYRALTRILILLLIALAFSTSGVLAQHLAAQNPPPLLILISVDGMRPDYVTAADAHGAKIPNLRRFLKEGTYADGVQGVIPTVTYPSHTTMLTGVWPIKHDILSNTTFDPLQKNIQGWYWYAEDIHAPTLWDVAAQAGRKTASIQWPVSVGAPITWNIPEYWRANTPDDQKLLRALGTPGLLAEAQAELGEYRGGLESALDGDASRGQYAQWILEKKHPDFLTLHLTQLDHVEHETGPFSAESIATLERLDAIIGNIRATAERAAPGRTSIAVVSDHGFVKTEQKLNLFRLFRDANLFVVDEGGKLQDWQAMPWINGGSAAIVLKDPSDSATLAKVREVLASAQMDAANGIDRVLDAEQLHQRGGYPNASFFVSLQPGWGLATTLAAPVVAKAKTGGTHGELPDVPELRSAFFLLGPGIPAGRSLGLIDMRDIAPTLGYVMGLALPTADGKNLLP